MANHKNPISDQKIIEAASTEPTMLRAANSIDVPYTTFIRRAKALGVYNPNQGAAGLIRTGRRKYRTVDILAGKHPTYGSDPLRRRLFKEGYKARECEVCGISEWQGRKAPLELHHKDGNSRNHLLPNLQILCPNCHAQTDTYKKKNFGNGKRTR